MHYLFLQTQQSNQVLREQCKVRQSIAWYMVVRSDVVKIQGVSLKICLIGWYTVNSQLIYVRTWLHHQTALSIKFHFSVIHTNTHKLFLSFHTSLFTCNNNRKKKKWTIRLSNHQKRCANSLMWIALEV